MSGWWWPIETAPEGVVVDTCIDDGAGNLRNVQALKRHGRLWWTPDAVMYVYYTPTHWRPVGGHVAPDTLPRRGIKL